MNQSKRIKVQAFLWFHLSFHLVPHMPRLVAISLCVMENKAVLYFAISSFIVIFFIFINNHGKQCKMLIKDQLQPDGCKLLVLLISLCVKKHNIVQLCIILKKSKIDAYAGVTLLSYNK